MDLKKNENPRPPCNYQYRPQHGTRPAHMMPQSSLVFQPMQYQQPHPPRFYPYIRHHPFLGYNNPPPTHSTQYYPYPNRAQMPARNLASAAPLPPPPPLLHHPPPAIHQAVPKRSHRLAIIDPVTQQDIFSELKNENSSSTESQDRRNPQQDHSIAEEFNRMVTEAANQPSNTTKPNHIPKKEDSVPYSTNQPEIVENPNHSVKYDSVINDNSAGAMPKMTMNVKPLQSEIIPSVTETSGNLALNQTVVGPNVTVNVNPTQKSDIVETSKNLGPNKTVIVPKMTMNVMPMQKSENVNKSVIEASVSVNMNVAHSNEGKATSKMDIASPSSSIIMESTAPSIPIEMPQPASMPQSYSLRPQTVAVRPQPVAVLPQPAAVMPQPAPIMPQPAAVLPQPAAVLPQSAPVMQQSAPIRPQRASMMPKFADLMPQPAIVKPLQAAIMPKSAVVVPQQATIMPQPAAIMPQPAPIMHQPAVVMPQPIAVMPLAPFTATNAGVKTSPQPQIDGSHKLEEKEKGKEVSPKESQSLGSKRNSPVPDSDTALGNTADAKTKTAKEYINKNHKGKNKKNSKKAAKMAANTNDLTKEPSSQIGKDETDKVTLDINKNDKSVKNKKNSHKKAVSKELDGENKKDKVIDDIMNKNKVTDKNSNKKTVSDDTKEPESGAIGKDATDKVIEHAKNDKVKGNKKAENNDTKEASQNIKETEKEVVRDNTTNYDAITPQDKKPVDNPIEKAVEKPVDEPIAKPVDEPIEKPVDEPIEKLVDEQIEKPVDEQIEKPVDEPIEKSVDEPIEKPVDEPIEKPVDGNQTTVTSPLVLKYKYSDDQWSPLNRTGKKCYSMMLLKQIKDDPASKSKPNVPILETCHLIRTSPMQDHLPFAPMLRPVNDSLFPTFAKGGGAPSRNVMGPPKKDGRNMPSGKGSVKLPPQGGSHQKVIHVSLSLRDEVKLNESESAWKPTRFKKDDLSDEELKTQELYKKFRGILNKLTPQKFDTLLDKVKTLNIDNQKRLEGVIDLIFEKAIEEPNFSEAYAAMCNKLSMLKVPADNATHPEQCVNFRVLIITKCQNQFQTNTTSEQMVKLEKEYEACTEPNKKKELHLMLQEENRRVRMRSVGNVRFIGELYKLKMLTQKIMIYCMNYLIEKLEEEKLECLCKLLTTIGEQIENEGATQIDVIFKKMQDIVDKKAAKISSRVKFMIQDVIELRKRRWVKKSVVDLKPKMMEQIQKEAEQQQRHIEIMNSGSIGGGRRDDNTRGKRGDSRRQNYAADNAWKPTKTTNFPVDTSKLKAVGQKNLSNIKLAPHQSSWNHGSGAKPAALANNMYSALDSVQTDPISLRGTRDMTPAYHTAPKGASIERSTFSSRGGFNIDSSNSGTRSQSRPPILTAAAETSPQTEPPKYSGARSQSALEVPPVSQGTDKLKSGDRSRSALEVPSAKQINDDKSNSGSSPPALEVPQEPLDDKTRNTVKCAIDMCIMNADVAEFAVDVKQLFAPRYHAGVVDQIVNVALDKNAHEVGIIAKSLLHLVSTNIISANNLIAGLKEIFEFAPDIYIDVPMLYQYLGVIVAPHIEKKHITFAQILSISESIIAGNQGHLLLKAIIVIMCDSMGHAYVATRWMEDGVGLSQWMKGDQVSKWVEENKFHFLEGSNVAVDETKNILTPAETRTRLLELMNTDTDCDSIKGWIQDKIGTASNEDWFIRALIQAIVEHACGTAPRFNQERMTKYIGLIEGCGTKEAREANCLFGIQRLIHNLEHPQGLTLEIFQYLHEQYIISLDGFLSWEISDKEPEGKGVMLVALTSFFNNIKEDNDDSSIEE